MKRVCLSSLLFVLMAAASSEAAIITTLISGNDCSNPNCVANENGTFSNTQATGSPFIIKFNAEFGVSEINPLYSTITGDEFAFTPDESGPESGVWTYTPGVGDPLIRFWTGKGGPNYNFFYDNGADNVGGAVPVTTGEWFTPINPNNGNRFGLSHISFYDTALNSTDPDPDPDPVPEPASLLLMGVVLALGVRHLRQ